MTKYLMQENALIFSIIEYLFVAKQTLPALQIECWLLKEEHSGTFLSFSPENSDRSLDRYSH